jgi:hypothetical protein
MSEWLKVMLEEIARKKAEAEQVRAEAQRRGGDESVGGSGGDGSGGDDSPLRPGPDTDRARE